MARIFLLACNVTREPYPVYPLGLAMIAGSARRAGHEVMEWDLLSRPEPLEQTAARARDFRPGVIGLSLRNVDNTDSVENVSYVDHYHRVVEALRREIPACPIVIGGAAVSLFPEELLRHTGGDYAVVGEGETAFNRLVAELTSGAAPPQQRVRRAEQPIAPADIRGHERDSAAAKYYLTEGGMLNVQTKRGCPYRCAYCTYPLIEGCGYRQRPAADVVDEIEHLRKDYGADYFAFTDSVFNDAEGHYLEIAEEMVRRGLNIPWMAFLRPQRFTREEAALLRRSGLKSVEWGTDCASDATLEGMQKDFTWAEVAESNRLFAESGIAGAHFIIFGGPGETEETVREGLRNLEALEGCVVFSFRGVRIYPGTAVHRRAIEEGVIEVDRNLLPSVFYYSPRVTQDFIHRAVLESFGTRPDRIYPPTRGQEKIHAFHLLGYRGPIWDLILRKKTAEP